MISQLSPNEYYYQPRPSRPRRNVGPPNLFGERRYIDIVLEKEDPATEVITLEDDLPTSLRAIFSVISPSDFLTPLAGSTVKNHTRCQNCTILVLTKIQPIGTSQPHSDLDLFSKFFIRILLLTPTYSRCHN